MVLGGGERLLQEVSLQLAGWHVLIPIPNCATNVVGTASGSTLSPPSLFSCSDLKLRVRILIDGTLIIFRVKPEDAGKYTCIPSNSLGRSPSASAYLTVQCECGQPDPEGEGWDWSYLPLRQPQSLCCPSMILGGLGWCDSSLWMTTQSSSAEG